MVECCNLALLISEDSQGIIEAFRDAGSPMSFQAIELRYDGATFLQSLPLPHSKSKLTCVELKRHTSLTKT